ncbi:hypothetical protein HY338_01435 [Candidatus Gottesmanbacteria bacterium]|nr:hypothetical protein [Candidatus Gottesmanbacteria bacterium]
MSVKIDELVSVELIFDSRKKSVYPRRLKWQNRIYAIDKIGLHHTVRRGRDLFHIFSVSARNSFFRLSFNTDNLHWRLEEVEEGIN